MWTSYTISSNLSFLLWKMGIIPQSFVEIVSLEFRFEAETPILWPPDVKNWLIGKDSDAGKNWRQDWDGWMALLTRWTWVCASSRSWWWTRKLGVLPFMEFQRVRHNWMTELNWTKAWMTCCLRLDVSLEISAAAAAAAAKSLQSCPHRWQPTRLPIPAILQARTLEWVAISFPNAWKWKVKVKLLSRVRPSATPWTAALVRQVKRMVTTGLKTVIWSPIRWNEPVVIDSKESARNAGDLGLIPRSGRSPEEGNSYSHQYSCLENSMDRGAWRATVHGVAKSWAQLSD